MEHLWTINYPKISIDLQSTVYLALCLQQNILASCLNRCSVGLFIFVGKSDVLLFGTSAVSMNATINLCQPLVLQTGGSRRWTNESYSQTGPRWPTVGLAGRLFANEDGGSLITMWVLLTCSQEWLRPCEFHTHTFHGNIISPWPPSAPLLRWSLPPHIVHVSHTAGNEHYSYRQAQSRPEVATGPSASAAVQPRAPASGSRFWLMRTWVRITTLLISLQVCRQEMRCFFFLSVSVSPCSPRRLDGC